MREIIALETKQLDTLLAAANKAAERWNEERHFKIEQEVEEIIEAIKKQRHGRTGQTGPLGGKQNG